MMRRRYPLRCLPMWTLAAAAAVFLTATPAQAITDRQIVDGLEKLGDLEAAHPLAVKLAAADGGYKAWRDVAAAYAKYDAGNSAYLAAWAVAQKLNSEGVYEDFYLLRPRTQLAAAAAHRVFESRRKLDTIDGYRAYIQRFPDTVEAVPALLRIHEIAWDRARKEDKVEVYDAFIIAFPLAQQAPDANRRAEELTRAEVDGELRGETRFSNSDKRERIARFMFNEAREAEKIGRIEIAARNYGLMSDPRFRDTRPYTEWLDRQDRQKFESALIDQQKRITQSIDAMSAAVSREIRDVKMAVDDHGRRMDAAMRAQGDELRRYADSAAVSAAGSVSAAIQSQTSALEQAARDNRTQNAVLFQRAQEEARGRDYKARRCAEILTRDGKYGWFDGCS